MGKSVQIPLSLFVDLTNLIDDICLFGKLDLRECKKIQKQIWDKWEKISAHVYYSNSKKSSASDEERKENFLKYRNLIETPKKDIKYFSGEFQLILDDDQT